MAKNDDFRVSVDYFEHPKTISLIGACGKLGVFCHLKLIAFAAKFSPNTGSLAKWRDQQLEAFAGWDGAPGQFIQALIDNRLLDGDDCARVLHDWADAQGWLIGTAQRKYNAQLGAWTQKLGSKEKAEEFLKKKTRARSKAPSKAPSTAGGESPAPAPAHSPQLLLTAPAPTPAPTADNQNLPATPAKRGNGRAEKVVHLPGNGKAPSKSGLTWSAYSTAYHDRYSVDPVTNAKTNALLCQLVDRVGADDAPKVAAFYVGHPSSFYVQRMHPVDLLVRDAEKLRTEWATNRQVTSTEAQQKDRTATTGNAARNVIREIDRGTF